MSTPSIEELIARGVEGDRQALARLLSMAEYGGPRLLEIESCLSSLPANAFVVGITGPPGAGKSTLINALLPHALENMSRVAVLAVDPSSPVSGGAILGDRVRMQPPGADTSVFIRSVASRGEMGGLVRTAATLTRLFDACGWPLVIVETLGIGQVELDVMDVADAVVVVLNPGWGDTIQANKAGLTEVGDIFAINKADRPGAEQCRKDLLESLSLLQKKEIPPVIETVATGGEGLEDLWRTVIERHPPQVDSDESGKRGTARKQRWIRRVLAAHLHRRVETALDSRAAESIIADIAAGRRDLATSLEELAQRLDADP